MIIGGITVWKFYGLAAFVILLDQWTKWLVVKNMELGERIILWDPYFALLSHRNRGAAWGILQGQMALFAVITVVVVAAIIYYFHKEAKGKPFFQTGLMLILGGAIGNFIDRMWRGEVVDFADVLIPIINYDFPIFNIADAALTFGVIFIILFILKEERIERAEKKKVK